MSRPTEDQILELWRSVQASARIDNPDPLLEVLIGRFANSLLDKWQYAEADNDMDGLFDNSNWTWAEEDSETNDNICIF
jgi:hypothetical protein